MIGICLIFYGMFLTPCYFEPWDVVISTTYIATANAMGVPLWIIAIWIISGYIAIFSGLILGVTSIYRIKHPVFVGSMVTIIATIVVYYAFFVINILG